MGGSVEVSSKFGEGTEFRLNIKTHCLVKAVRFKGHMDLNKLWDSQGMIFLEKDEYTNEISSIID